MLQRLDPLPTVGINTVNNYATDIFSFYENKSILNNYQQPNNRRLYRPASENSEFDPSSFSSSITLDNNSWSDCTYSPAPSNNLCYSSSINSSTLIEKASTNSERRRTLFSAEGEIRYADRQNQDDARNALDGVTEDQGELTDDEMTLFGDEINSLEMDDCHLDILLTPSTSSTTCEFIKKKEIPFVNQKSLLSSMLLHHHPPAFASSSSLPASPLSSLNNTCSSNHTTNVDVLSSSMKKYVHWEKIQNSGPAGLMGFQKTRNSSIHRASSILPIKNSFDTSTSCW